MRKKDGSCDRDEEAGEGSSKDGKRFGGARPSPHSRKGVSYFHRRKQEEGEESVPNGVQHTLTPRSGELAKSPKSTRSRRHTIGPTLRSLLRSTEGRNKSKGDSEKSKKSRERNRSLVGSSKIRSRSMALGTLMAKKEKSGRHGSKDAEMSSRFRSIGDPFDIGHSFSMSERSGPSERFCSGRYDGKASIANSPRLMAYGSESVISNWESAMGLPEEETMEEIFHIASECSASETEAISIHGIFSSLIAIENDI